MRTAKSYEGATIVKEFEKGGKPYAHIRIQCDRCTKGIYAIGVENGHIKPHPVANGVCFKCGGTGYITKDVRLYTEEEFARMEKVNEVAREKKRAEQEAKMKAEFEEKRLAWLEKNNFTSDGYTYIYINSDSYSIKDELKMNGWRYDPVIKWHKADPAGYEDKVILRHVEEFFEASAWGDYHYKEGAKNIADKLFAAAQPQVTSIWVGEVGEKIKDIKVQLVRKFTFETKYGISNCYHFQTEEGNVLVWFSSTFQEFEQGEWLKIKYCTVKKHDTYNGIQQTIITRAKLTNLVPA